MICITPTQSRHRSVLADDRSARFGADAGRRRTSGTVILAFDELLVPSFTIFQKAAARALYVHSRGLGGSACVQLHPTSGPEFMLAILYGHGQHPDAKPLRYRGCNCAIGATAQLIASRVRHSALVGDLSSSSTYAVAPAVTRPSANSCIFVLLRSAAFLAVEAVLIPYALAVMVSFWVLVTQPPRRTWMRRT